MYRPKITKTVRISKQTKASLDELRHPGQSYDGVLQELLECWQREQCEQKREPEPENEVK
ncbi:MAG: hypothetical protein HYX92_14845 [Chloroflexi bacterium]|nr:hypothetical protein [Chloroflexota bacterium]